VYYSPTPRVSICGDLSHQIGKNWPEIDRKPFGVSFVAVAPDQHTGGYL